MHPYPITKKLYPQGHLGVGGRVGGGNTLQQQYSTICNNKIFCISDYPMIMSHLNSPTQLCISDYPASHLWRIMCSLGGPPQSTPRNKWTQGTLRRRMCSLGGGPPPQPALRNKWTQREPRSVKHYWTTRHLQGSY